MLEIVYEDENILAIDKPSKLLVHPTSLDKYESESALQILEKNFQQKLFPIHRIDKATSGILLFAKSANAAKNYQENLKSPQCVKQYIAVVRGWVDRDQTIDYPLGSLESPEKKKDAISLVRPLEKVELAFAVDKFPSTRYSIVLVRILTGRTHQIRRHLRHLGHPLIGDTTYGVGVHNRFFRDHYQIDNLWLRSIFLQMPNSEGDLLSINLTLNDPWSYLMQQWKISSTKICERAHNELTHST